MKKYSYDEFGIDCKKLSQQIKTDFNPACIVAISRGGLSLDVLRQNFNTCELKTASLFYKKSAQIKPDYFINFTDEWIEFAWEAL